MSCAYDPLSGRNAPFCRTVRPVRGARKMHSKRIDDAVQDATGWSERADRSAGQGLRLDGKPFRQGRPFQTNMIVPSWKSDRAALSAEAQTGGTARTEAVPDGALGDIPELGGQQKLRSDICGLRGRGSHDSPQPGNEGALCKALVAQDQAPPGPMRARPKGSHGASSPGQSRAVSPLRCGDGQRPLVRRSRPARGHAGGSHGLRHDPGTSSWRAASDHAHATGDLRFRAPLRCRRMK